MRAQSQLLACMVLSFVALVSTAALDPTFIEESASADNFWMTQVAHGSNPYAPAGYPIFRNVLDYGAKGDGVTDDTEAINTAIQAGGRCGADCGSTSVLGAVVYFPAGTYIISAPIFQYYYTQFIGNPNARPILKATANFTGIALIDSDFYIPGSNGDEWYVNQNNFYRQIRNLILDISALPPVVSDGVTNWVPTALHWQVAQATSLYNMHFIMSTTSGNNQVGISMENGSGGFISDLTFFGGQYGMKCGSQQFTARDLHFTSCITAIQMIWDWTWTWKNIYIYSCWVGIDVTGGDTGTVDGQPVGSITVMDSSFSSVPIGVLTSGKTNIYLDNVATQDCGIIVGYPGGPTLLEGNNQVVQSWAMGRVYDANDANGYNLTGSLNVVPSKPASLLDSTGSMFIRSKPQYETLSASSFYNVKSSGAQGDGVNDDTAAINSALQPGSIVFFPAGVYKVTSQIFIPVGARIVGEAWSQIMGTGSYFNDTSSPKAMVKVGNPGDSGVIEIQDMIFTTSGPTPGAILMEWNVKQSSQGSAAMWDSHFRVGGAIGTNLQSGDCPKLTGFIDSKCLAASMLLHLTGQSSAYLENVWAWVADHDVDIAAQTQVSVYSARGVLIESKGPTWLWGTASEHSASYQYQLSEATDIFMGLIQTESPYYQPSPAAPFPYYPAQIFPDDPIFEDCNGSDTCPMAWALRIISSTDVYIYGAGLYSWFQNYNQTCVPLESCQDKVVETSYSQGVWMYGIATKGSQQVVTPAGIGLTPAMQSDNQNGYTTAVAAWLILATSGGALGKQIGLAYTPGPLRSGFTWAAMGDSYSAGPGAGIYAGVDYYNGYECLVYGDSYPGQMVLKNGLNCPTYGNQIHRVWEFLSCSGAVMNRRATTSESPLLLSQVAIMKPGLDFILLSIGGNDVLFSKILDNCIFAFGYYASQDACDQWLGDAEALLEVDSQDKLEGQEIVSRLVDAYVLIIFSQFYRTGATPRSNFRMFVTPYNNFFNDQTGTAEGTNCDNVNFKWSWYNSGYKPENLTQTNRLRYNRLVNTLNHRIQQAVDTVNNYGNVYGNRIRFIDDLGDLYGQDPGHRFCEANSIKEPDSSRAATWFFLPNLNPWSLTGITDNNEIDPPTTSELAVAETVDAYFDTDSFSASIEKEITEQAGDNSSFIDWKRTFVGIFRTFHPNSAGFQTIAERNCYWLCRDFPGTAGC